MKKLKKSVEIAGNVFGLVIGSKLNTPMAHTLQEHSSLRFGGFALA